MSRRVPKWSCCLGCALGNSLVLLLGIIGLLTSPEFHADVKRWLRERTGRA